MLDKTNGNERTILGRNPNSRENCTPDNSILKSGTTGKTDFISSGPSGWDGYKTASLKPAYEPILAFRAPRHGMTYVELVTKYGTGCLNVDGGRIGGKGAKMWETPKGGIWHHSIPGDQRMVDNPRGRYPANLILDEGAADMLGPDVARFFYCPKASKRERNAGLPEGQKNTHPTVKPIALAEHLAKLLLPPECVSPRRLMVPFLGSGSEMIGAQQAGWDEIVGIEQDAGYCEIAEARVAHHRQGLGPGTYSGIGIGHNWKNGDQEWQAVHWD